MKTHCVYRTDQGWYDVGTDGENNPYCDEILESGLSYWDAYARAMEMRTVLLIHIE